MTQLGIKPVIFQLVAQCLTQLCQHKPQQHGYILYTICGMQVSQFHLLFESSKPDLMAGASKYFV